MLTPAYTHTYIYAYIHTCTHIHTYMHTYIQTYIHTYIHLNNIRMHIGAHRLHRGPGDRLARLPSSR